MYELELQMKCLLALTGSMYQVKVNASVTCSVLRFLSVGFGAFFMCLVSFLLLFKLDSHVLIKHIYQQVT